MNYAIYKTATKELVSITSVLPEELRADLSYKEIPDSVNMGESQWDPASVAFVPREIAIEHLEGALGEFYDSWQFWKTTLEGAKTRGGIPQAAIDKLTTRESAAWNIYWNKLSEWSEAYKP